MVKFGQNLGKGGQKVLARQHPQPGHQFPQTDKHGDGQKAPGPFYIVDHRISIILSTSSFTSCRGQTGKSVVSGSSVTTARISSLSLKTGSASIADRQTS